MENYKPILNNLFLGRNKLHLRTGNVIFGDQLLSLLREVFGNLQSAVTSVLSASKEVGNATLSGISSFYVLRDAEEQH